MLNRTLLFFAIFALVAFAGIAPAQGQTILNDPFNPGKSGSDYESPLGSPEDARAWFRALKRLAAEHAIEGLSMGMTDDFEVAIEEGATIVRIGSRL